MGILEAVILGLVQGLTEFLPVSSSGHLILVREWLGIAGSGLAEDAVLQAATVAAVLLYFSKDLIRLARGTLSWVVGRPPAAEDRTLILALAIGTAPAVILGLMLEEVMSTVFRDPILVAYTLIAGSVVFLIAEWVSARKKHKKSAPSVFEGLLIGVGQALALVPGMSRSGMTISAGLLLGLSREGAARFGFLLSVPIIAGAGAKKLLDLADAGALVTGALPLLVGSLVAFVSGLFAIHALLVIVRKTSLLPFALYRVVLAALVLAMAL